MEIIIIIVSIPLILVGIAIVFGDYGRAPERGRNPLPKSSNLPKEPPPPPRG